jgi:DNA-binding beta-propeller fold protein YncE
VPTITALEPSNAPIGSADLTVTVRGNGFVSASAVRWNGADRPTTFISSSELTAAITAADLAAPAAVPVTVFSPGSGGGLSSAVTFHVLGPAAVPALVDLAPIALAAAGPDFLLTVTGRGFNVASMVLWNGAQRPTRFVSENELEAAIPSSDIVSGGIVSISVYTPPPGGGTSESLPLLVENPPPLAVALVPGSAAVGQSDLAVRIRGTDFVPGIAGAATSPGSRVQWNGTERPVTFVSSTELRITVPASDLAQPESATVTVTNPPPSGGTSVLTFTVYVPVELTAADLAYDAGSERIYAALPANAPSLANSVAALDPTTGDVLFTVPVGDDPGFVTVSDDGRFIYVALRGLPAVRRIDIAARAMDLEIALGTGAGGESLYAGDLAVVPGVPRSIAVARSTRPVGDVNGQHGGVVLYDDDVPRPMNTLGSRLVDSDRIAFSDSATLLYGVDNQSSTGGAGSSLLRMAVSASGVSITDSTLGLIDGFNTNIEFGGGLVFTSAGLLLDPVAPARVGAFNVFANDTNLVWPDVPRERVYFMQNLSELVFIYTFDLATLGPLGMQNLSPMPGPAGSLLRWGPEGLAYRAGGQIIFLRTL